MTQLSRLSRSALDSYLRGEHGELMRGTAEQELYERGRQSMTEKEMIDYLVSQGYVVLSPQDLKESEEHRSCAWCGADMD